MKYRYNFDILGDLQISLPIVNSIIQLILIITVLFIIKYIFRILPKSQIFIKSITALFSVIIIVLPTLIEVITVLIGLPNIKINSTFEYCCGNNTNINNNSNVYIYIYYNIVFFY